MNSNDSTDIFKNTSLHQAILLNHTEEALSIIAAEKEKALENTLINVDVLGNTPLLLALKTGNISVALALLNNPNILVDYADNMGMQAIHWACFLRMNTVIEKLIPLSTPAIIETEMLEHFRYLFQTMKPVDFYKASFVDQNKLELFNFIEGQGLILTDKLIIQRSFNFFTPKSMLTASTKIRSEMPNIALTNLAYHIDSLCINYCEMNREIFMRSYNVVEDDMTKDYKSAFPRSADIFKHNFLAGYTALAAMRNRIPVDEKILTALELKEKSQEAFKK